MGGSKHFSALALGFSLASLCGGCSPPPGSQSGGDRTGTIRASLSALSSDDVATVRIDVSAGGMVVASQTISSLTTPGTADSVGLPFGDALFVLPPDTYQVVATPFGADGEPLTTCRPAQVGAMVTSGVTTEIMLTLVCGSTPNGGLDVVVNTSDPPLITNLVIDPSKFTRACAPITLTVTAVDPKGEALTYDWSIVSSPPQMGPDKPVVQLLPNGPQASFFTDAVGDYTLSVTAINAEKRTASLSFPVHVVAGDVATCNPRFDTLNHWSPPGPPVELLTYGSRVHIFPMPGAPLPDPI